MLKKPLIYLKKSSKHLACATINSRPVFFDYVEYGKHDIVCMFWYRVQDMIMV
jgi:hypothetical protein